MRSVFLTLGSLFLSAVVIGNAYFQKKQFYPSVVYITKSNPSMAVMYIQALVIVILTGELMRKLFFGQLRTAELEHLIDRSWYVVTETCLAFTIFRDDFSPKFIAFFTLLLFLKCFHWLGDDRVDYMERSPAITMLFHIRVISLLVVLGFLDAYFVQLAYHSMLTKGASVQLVFGFEYAILFTVVVNIFIKYVLHTIDLHSENPWENKAVFLLYTELVVGLVKMVLYMLFVGIMIKIHTFPLFAIRPMYLTMRTFKKALNDVIMSRRAIRNMNTLYPDATAEELATLDNVCIICREEMTTASKKLPCNHIFHASCLRSWFQRQQTCPTCRMDVLRLPPPQTQPPQVPAAQAQPQQPLAAAAAQNRQDNGGPQPPPPPFVPLDIPGMQVNFPMWTFPFPNQPTQNGSNEAQPGVSSGSSGSISLPGSAHVFPPFPPFFFPPMVPPSASSVTEDYLRNLSEEDLRRLEGNEREHLEARIKVMRNIQSLIDSAVYQYTQLAAIPRPTAVTENPSRMPTNLTDGLS
ncbi:hypothetical protein CHUAL_006307 [Chamberlinius hualienensis]